MRVSFEPQAGKLYRYILSGSINANINIFTLKPTVCKCQSYSGLFNVQLPICWLHCHGYNSPLQSNGCIKKETD